MRNRVTNTTRLARERLDVILADSAVMGPSEAIEASERAGQAELLVSEVLPTDTGGTDAAFEAVGFVFGEPVDGDPLFRAATLPQGWERRGSSHAMWSAVYDEQGFSRVGIFYKAAFYDRSAFMRLHRVPETDAQHDAIGAIYESILLSKRGEGRWGDMQQESRADRAIVATWSLRKIQPWPEPPTIYATRCVVVLPDGSIESDVTKRSRR